MEVGGACQHGVDKNHESTGLIGPNLKFTPPVGSAATPGFHCRHSLSSRSSKPFFSRFAPLITDAWTRNLEERETSPRYLPDLRGIPYNHVHTCTCTCTCIYYYSCQRAYCIPMIHLRRTNVISRDRHVIIIPDLTLPRQRGAIQVHHPFCWSHTVDLVLQRGFPPPLPPALLFHTISADLGGI